MKNQSFCDRDGNNDAMNEKVRHGYHCCSIAKRKEFVQTAQREDWEGQWRSHRLRISVCNSIKTLFPRSFKSSCDDCLAKIDRENNPYLIKLCDRCRSMNDLGQCLGQLNSPWSGVWLEESR
jgi:hypothetical protein